MKHLENHLIIIQNTIPGYRVVFFSHLKEMLASRFFLYAGTDTFDKSITPAKDYKPDVLIKNKFILGRRLMYYQGIKVLLRCPATLIFELNPRNLSIWFFLLYRKFLGLPTVLWGHAWPRAGKKARTNVLRNLMKNLATSIITYTELQKEELKESMPGKSIFSSSNGLLRENEMETSLNNDKIKGLIYVGRLIQDKKAILLYEAFKKALPYLPKGVVLKIIGSGPDRNVINRKITEDGLNASVILLNSIFDNSKLKKYYHSSFFSVSPGYVGLNLIQSLGYGVPMIISENEPHSPEIEAVELKENSIYFETDSIENLKQTFIEVYNDYDHWHEKRPLILKECQKNYSIERMAQPFLELIYD